MKRTALRRYTPLRAKRKHPEVWVGKVTGCIRLSGKALEALRLACYQRDRGICWKCGDFAHFISRTEGDPLVYDMAHIKSRGAGGSDTLENVKTMHHKCHMEEHSGHHILHEHRGRN